MNNEPAGARLKKIRQEKGLSLEDMHKRTKINPNILRAIEGDSISNLSPIYLKGFIKIYCGSLGLDFKEYTGQAAQPVKPVLNAVVGRPIGERVEKKPALAKDVSLKLSSPGILFNLKKIAIYALSVVVVVFLAVNFFKPARAQKKTQLEKAKVLMAVSAPKSTVQQAKPVKDLASGFTVGIFARNKSWVSAKADGKTIFHGFLTRGRSETWRAKEKIELSLGDAGVVELQVNDQRFLNLARPGKPLKNILINKEGLKISK